MYHAGPCKRSVKQPGSAIYTHTSPPVVVPNRTLAKAQLPERCVRLVTDWSAGANESMCSTTNARTSSRQQVPHGFLDNANPMVGDRVQQSRGRLHSIKQHTKQGVLIDTQGFEVWWRLSDNVSHPSGAV